MTQEPLLPYGKLPYPLLEELLRASRGAARDDVVLGPSVGTDAALTRLPDGRFLVAATDPITFATDRIGWYAVHVNANDVAVCGAEPRWFLSTLLLPPCDESLVRSIVAGIAEAAEQLGIAVVGGHTEVTVGLDRPIVVGTMLGVADRPLSASGASPQDLLYCSGPVAVEGTAILAVELAHRLRDRVPDTTLARARRLLDEPGISVVRPALLAARTGASALHDVTEGGIMAAVWEMARASSCGVELMVEEVPVLPETRELCAALDCDPYRLLGSGTLLIAIAPSRRTALEEAFRQQELPLAVIGRFRGDGRMIMRCQGQERPLEGTARDELARLLA